MVFVLTFLVMMFSLFLMMVGFLIAGKGFSSCGNQVLLGEKGEKIKCFFCPIKKKPNCKK